MPVASDVTYVNHDRFKDNVATNDVSQNFNQTFNNSSRPPQEDAEMSEADEDEDAMDTPEFQGSPISPNAPSIFFPKRATLQTQALISRWEVRATGIQVLFESGYRSDDVLLALFGLDDRTFGPDGDASL